ncbi:GNAT family N-acetyltransferase [Nitrospira sp. Nam80]
MIVPAPFDPYDPELLERCFSKVIPFKSHYVADLTRPIDQIVKKSHRDTVARVIKKVCVSHCLDPASRLTQWIKFFETLTARHRITGIRAFSAGAFATQFAIPGMVMFEARAGDEPVGLDLWYLQDDVAYGHLVAFSELGYSVRASYATKWFVLNYFAGRVRWVDFGGGAGTKADGTDGLSVFKQGWSTGSVPVYLCCRIFNDAVYRELTGASSNGETTYFPAYRAGELL